MRLPPNTNTTSHGKSPCDGLGDTKRLVARASLQATVGNQILTAYQMFEWADKNIEGIKYFYVSNNAVKTSADAYKLDAQFSLSKPFAVSSPLVPMSEGKLQM